MYGPQDRPNTIPMNASEEQIQAALAAFRPSYLKAKACVDGEDDVWVQKKHFLETKIYRLIKSFTENDSATKAVLILGQAQAIAAELDQPRLIVAEYESLRQRFLREAYPEE